VRQLVKDFIVLPSDDLGDFLYPMNRIARIDALGAVTQAEVAAAPQSGFPLN
jgi:hypothetical protein